MKTQTEVCRDFRVILDMSEAEARALKLVLWKASREAPNSFDLMVIRKIMTSLPVYIGATDDQPKSVTGQAL